MNSLKKNILPFLFVFLTMTSITQWSSFPIGNTFTDWTLFLTIMLTFLFQNKYWYDKSNKDNLWALKIYLFWVIICFIRGVFVAEFYWDFKNLINGGFALLMVYSVYAFTNPIFVQLVFKKWLQIAFPLFILFILVVDIDAYGFYLIPISFFALFLPIMNSKWKLIIVSISLFVIVASVEARANVIKFSVPILFSSLFYFRKMLVSKLLAKIQLFVFILPFVLLFLATTGIFNIFKMDEYVSTKSNTIRVNSQGMEEDLLGDSRTFLFQEVILSAIKNDYVLFGRTLARGNDSASFGAGAAEELRTFRYERYDNEVGILNVFTWTGIVGVILYFFIFFKAAKLAIVYSNSYFLKILGIYVSFRWLTAWIEDFNRFDIMNLFIWIVVGMCYSKQFRKMSDQDFKIWMKGIFKRNNKKQSFISDKIPSNITSLNGK